jgi:hypothetical protein
MDGKGRWMDNVMIERLWRSLSLSELQYQLYLHILFKSKYGRRFTEKTVAAKKAPGFQPTKVIVYCEDSFGIFDIQEYTELVT